MKLSSALTVAVVGLLAASLDAAQQVRGRSNRAGRGGVRGHRRLMKTGKSSNTAASTGYWSGNARPNPTEAVINSITITSNNGGGTSTVTQNNNNGSGRGSDPVEGSGASITGISVTPNNGSGASTVVTPNNNNGSSGSSGGGSGGASITGITVTPNNGSGASTVVTPNNNNGSGRDSAPVEGNGASITGITVTKNNGVVTYQSGTQAVAPTTGYTQTANTFAKKSNKKSKGRAARRIYKPQAHPDMSQAHVGAVTVNGKPVDSP